MMSDKFGVDVWEVISLANRHPRVKILNPGPGVGGHCISVDPWFLVEAAPEVTPLIRTAREVNNAKPHHVIAQVMKLVKQMGKPTIGCLSLTYKADVDDLRESPSVEIFHDLVAHSGCEVLACDPCVDRPGFKDFPLYSLDTVLKRSDIIVLLTDHKPFYEIPVSVLKQKILVDTRGIWRKALQAADQQSKSAA
jgi:UDP-N-acetyl-D-mannosaminuronic acid dehydrogenase